MSVRASLQIQVYAECPNCEDGIVDLMETSHNEEGGVIMQACPDGDWNEKHEKFQALNVKCSECRAVFDVNGLDW